MPPFVYWDSKLVVFLYALLCVTSSFETLKMKRELIRSLLLSFEFIETINVVWLFLVVP